MNRFEFYDNIKGYKETKEDSLAHYGIIGQKWGTRRWQNQDGTFNEEGKIRYFGKSSKARHEGNDQNISKEKIYSLKDVDDNFAYDYNKSVYKTIKTKHGNITFDQNISDNIDDKKSKEIKNAVHNFDNAYDQMKNTISETYYDIYKRNAKNPVSLDEFKNSIDIIKVKYSIDYGPFNTEQRATIKNTNDDEIGYQVGLQSNTPDGFKNINVTFDQNGNIQDVISFDKNYKESTADQKIGGYIKDAENAMSSYSRAVNKMKEDTTREIANKFSESDQDKKDIIAAIEKNQDVIDKMTECLEDGNMKKYMKLRNKGFDDDFEKDIAEFYAEEMANKKKNRLAEYYVESTFGGENPEEKIGMVAEYPIAIVSSIKNYKNGEQLIQDIDKVISTGDEKYSKEELSSIMSNKKKLATMMDAADKGDDETYNKMAKKIKDKDKEAIEKFMKDANNQIIKTPVDENIQKDIEKISGFTKPKINKKYLNEDGTLNELGLKNTERNRKTSRVFASIFKGLRNANVYGGTVGTGILFAIMAATGVGMPAAISIALAGAATSGITAGVDHALYKKLEKRADNYYTELKTRV